MREGWRERTLGDLCDIQLGHTPARNSPRLWDTDRKTNNVWLSIADMSQVFHARVTDSREYISDEALGKAILVREGTLLVSFKLTLGRLAFAGRDLYTNEAIAALAIQNEQLITKKYLYWYFTFFDWQKAAEGDHKIKGKTLNKAKLEVLEVLVPPLPEQKRIVAILDEAFVAIATATANTEKNLANARELFESQLNAIYELGKSFWQTARFGDLCDFVRGPFGGSLKKSVFVESGVAVYEQQHAINDQFSSIRYFINEEKFSEMSRFELKPGDLIMSCSGTMGRVAIAPRDLRRGIINQALLKLTPRSDLLGGFLKLWMQSMSFQEQISVYSKGVAIKNVASVKVLKEIRTPLPTMKDQRTTVVKLHELETAIENLQMLQVRKQTSLTKLKQSILHKAFTGELTANEKATDRVISKAGV